CHRSCESRTLTCYTFFMSMSGKAYQVGSIVHVIKRGSRGLPIVKSNGDRYRFLKLLYFLNDATHPINWERDVDEVQKGLHFNRPKHWAGHRDLIPIFWLTV